MPKASETPPVAPAPEVTTQTIVEDFTNGPDPDAYAESVRVETEEGPGGVVIEHHY